MTLTSDQLNRIAEQATAMNRRENNDRIAHNAAQDVLTERRRQVEAEGWTTAHDDEHEDGQLAAAAASYAVASVNPSAFAAPPWT